MRRKRNSGAWKSPAARRGWPVRSRRQRPSWPVGRFTLPFFALAAAAAALAALPPAAGAEPVEVQLFDRDVTVQFSAGFTLKRVALREMEESGGILPEFDDYRMNSSRYLFTGTCRVNDRFAVDAILGLADLETHSREGETIEFDAAPVLGFGAEAAVYAPEIEPYKLIGSLRYVRFSPDGENIVAVARDQVSLGSDASLDWQELELALTGVVQRERCKLFCGLRYMQVDAEQDRDTAQGTVSSTFDPEGNVGIRAGIAYDLRDNVRCGFSATVLDEASYSFGIEYTF